MGKIMRKVRIRHVHSLGNTVVRGSRLRLLTHLHSTLALHLVWPSHFIPSRYYVRDPQLLFVVLTFLRTWWLLTLTLQTQFVALQFGSEFLIDSSRTSFAKSFILSMVLGLWVNSRTMDSE